MSWECARRPAAGITQKSTGHMASGSSSLRESQSSSWRWWTLAHTAFLWKQRYRGAMCDLRSVGAMFSGLHNVENLSLSRSRGARLVCLFLEDWELAWVALSRHLTFRSLCQENARRLVVVVLLLLLPTVAVF